MLFCRDFTGATGLEPATSGVTGRRSNQLNYAPQGDGLVLGLAVARGLMTVLGGSLAPEDTPGGGLTMVLSLPVAPTPALVG